MKQLFLPILLLAGALNSCTKDDVQQQQMQRAENTDVISFDAATASSKATDLTANLLRTNSSIELSYFDSSDPAKYDEIYFDYLSNEWTQVDDTNTPIESGSELMWSEFTYPVQFYSANDGNDNLDGIVKFDNFSGVTAQLQYSVTSPNIKEHKDLVYMSKTVAAKPSGGKIYGVFDHALSKTEITISTCEDVEDPLSTSYKVYMLKNELNNAQSKGYAIISSADNTILWNNQSDRGVGYSYLDVAANDLSGNSQEVVFSNASFENIKSSTDPDPDWNMMLIPQTLTAGNATLDGIDDGEYDAATWQAENISTIMNDIPYISVLYRMSDIDDRNIVGYAKGSDYLNDLTPTAEYDKATINSWKTTYGNKPLYVRVGFALNTDYNLMQSKYYKLNLDFYNHGGIYTDDHFYDETGARTDIPLPRLDKPGKPVIDPSDSDIICLLVDVRPWDDSEQVTINGTGATN